MFEQGLGSGAAMESEAMREVDSVKSVVITGASTGIGEACALRLDRMGHRVFAGVRREADGEALRAKGSQLIVPVRIDVTDEETIAEASQTIADILSDDGLAGVVNNAGVYFGGPLEFISLEGIRAEFEVNFFGTHRMIREVLPLIHQGRMPRTPQDHAQATEMPKRRPEDGLIDWTRPTDRLYDWVRALTHPYPGA